MSSTFRPTEVMGVLAEQRWRSGVIRAFVGLVFVSSAACTSVSSVALRTDGSLPRRHYGAVAIYPLVIPAKSRVVGHVAVQATGAEANVEVLMPNFVQRVAELGATGATVDSLRTSFELRTDFRPETRAFPCGFRATCWSTQLVPYQYVVRTLEIRGRALLPEDYVEARRDPASPTTLPPTSSR